MSLKPHVSSMLIRHFLLGVHQFEGLFLRSPPGGNSRIGTASLTLLIAVSKTKSLSTVFLSLNKRDNTFSTWYRTPEQRTTSKRPSSRNFSENISNCKNSNPYFSTFFFRLADVHKSIPTEYTAFLRMASTQLSPSQHPTSKKDSPFMSFGNLYMSHLFIFLL